MISTFYLFIVYAWKRRTDFKTPKFIGREREKDGIFYDYKGELFGNYLKGNISKLLELSKQPTCKLWWIKTHAIGIN